MGENPTHPRLLDWLASEFVEHGWSLKHMHRLIMTSAAYRQSSGSRAEAARIDPQNKLLWSFPRERLEAEVIRDSALAVAGILNTRMGGPSVFPELPPGMNSRGGWKVTEDPGERNRRSVYVFVRRNTRYPMFETFDMPDTHESCPRRHVTTTAPQALTMLNSKLSLEWAQAFAGRILRSARPFPAVQIRAAYRLAYSRTPSVPEEARALKFMERHRDIVTKRFADGGKLAFPTLPVPSGIDPVDGAVLVDLCHMLLNSNEFVYRN